MKIGVLATVAALSLLAGCNSNKKQAANEAQTTAPAATPAEAAPATEASGPKACDLFTAEDAAKILGVPAKPSTTHNTKPTICMYEEANPGSGYATVTLTVVSHDTAVVENADWAGLKEVRHLHAGEKNVQTLSGLGDEAYFDGDSKKGKAGMSGVIVRKGNSHFMLDAMSLEYRFPVAALKQQAEKVAAQLK